MLLFNVSKVEATPSDITQTTVDGMVKVSFKSNCTKYTTKGYYGDSNTQLNQSFYYNPNITGQKSLIWFQHGDSSSSPRNACENRFYATKVLAQEKGKNFIIFCPEMNSSNGTGSKTPENKRALWSINYEEFFKCLYDDFKNVAVSQKKLNISENTIFASHSQGGPATSKITVNYQKYPFIKIVGILRYDSCYTNGCEKEANIDPANRGPFRAYVSDVSNTDYKNNVANKAAVIERKIYLKPEVSAYLVVGKNHTQVPQLCTLDFLTNDNCGGIAKKEGGTTSEIESSGGTSVSDTSILQEVSSIVKTPILQISLPGLKFSEIQESVEGGNKFIFVPFLGEYLGAIYRYAVVIASILSIVMIILGGVGIVVSGGDSQRITQSKKRIYQSITGLVLAVGSYLILYTVNPNLVEFKSLKVLYVKEEPFLEGEGYGDPLDGGGVSGNILMELSQIPKGSGPQDCGKNLDKIAEGFTQLNTKVGLESCSCAWFVSTVLRYSGCDSSFTNKKAQTLREKLILKGWKQVSMDQAKPGDIVFYWDEKDKTKITHATVFYKREKGEKYIIDANTDFSACWTPEQKKMISAKCSGKDNINFKNSKEKKWGLIMNEKGEAVKRADGKPVIQTGDYYQQCIASLGICPILEDYRSDLCVSVSVLGTDRDPKIYDNDVSEACYTRQCIKSQRLGAKDERYSVIQNPNNVGK